MRIPLIPGLIFDHDGTLVDSLAVVVEATNAVLTSRGLPRLPAEVIIPGMTHPTAPRLSAAAGGVRPEEAEAMAAAFYREANRLPHLAKAYPGVAEVLAALAGQGRRLGMVSNNQGVFIRIVGSRLGILDHLAVVLGEEDVPAPKPDHRGLLQAAAGLGLAPGSCAYVGDSAGDALAARRAGMRAIGVTWGIHPRHEMDGMGFDVLIDTPQELLALG